MCSVKVQTKESKTKVDEYVFLWERQYLWSALVYYVKVNMKVDKSAFCVCVFVTV